ncbi:phytoene/squalene synthase family protein [Halorubellus sp. PRR65]|uniref:phytoene/squalene synthase family protein n=1 Tax=Halorubellus sp. PRR65 TaxID=3098148 RepID=UPI002B261579|nr:phytoene/squalene synthase family protein [Halorubellus sp. PRR65]
MSGRECHRGDVDEAWCHEAVQGVSRTFALTVDVLEEPMSTHICLGYLLCRVADTVEDAGHLPPDEQAALLRTYRDAVDPTAEATIEEFRADIDAYVPAEDERNDDWEVVARAPTVLATFASLPEDVQSAVVGPVVEMVDGMAAFVERYSDKGGLRIGDPAELEEYCHYAAGTVGELVTNLLTRTDVDQTQARRMQGTAEEFGQLLQLTNVSKDVYDDYVDENNVYLPNEWLEAEGVPQDEVVEPEHRGAAARVVQRTADHARGFLDDAQTYLESMPLVHGNTLEAWSVPFLLAVGTLRELGARPEDALTERGVKISREEVFAVTHAASTTGREALADLRQSIAREPYEGVEQHAD